MTPASRAIAMRCSTALVEPPVAATEAMAFSSACRVTGSSRAADRARSTSITSAPTAFGDVALAGVAGGHIAAAHRRESEELAGGRHRVGGELAAAGAGAGQARSSSAQSPSSVSRPAPWAPTASKTSWIVTSRSVDPSGGNGPAVEDQTGDVEPCERHRGRGDGLVAPDEDDERVEQVAAGDQLDRIGDHLAADERRPHAGRAHRDSVGDRHGVELHRRAAGAPDAAA